MAVVARRETTQRRDSHSRTGWMARHREGRVEFSKTDLLILSLVILACARMRTLRLIFGAHYTTKNIHQNHGKFQRRHSSLKISVPLMSIVAEFTQLFRAHSALSTSASFVGTNAISPALGRSVQNC